MDSIDFDFLLEGEADDEPPPQAPCGSGDEMPSRDPRVVRSIEEVSCEAEMRLSRLQHGPECGPSDAADGDLGMTDDEVLALDESDLECLWPTWGERRTAQLGRGVPPGVTVVPQHLPKSASAGGGRPLNYK